MTSTLLLRLAALLLFLVSVPAVLCQGQSDVSHERTDSHIVEYDVYLTSRDPDGLAERMLRIAQSKGSEPWLSREELKGYVAHPQEVRDSITARLKRAGAHQIDVNDLGTVLRVRSTLDVASRVFGKHLQSRGSGGRSSDLLGFARSHSLPRDIAQYVQSIPALKRLSNQQSRRHLGRPKKRSELSRRKHRFEPPDNPKAKLTDPEECGAANYWTSTCLRALYGLGQTAGSPGDAGLAIVAGSPADVSEEDFQRIMSEAHPDITDYKPTVMGSPDTQVSFNNSYDSPSYELAEDSQAAGPLIAPMPLKVFLVDIGRLDIEPMTPFYRRVLEMSEEDRPAVISLSFAGFELSFSQEEIDTHCNLAQQLTALGTTIVASSGDGGILCEDKTPSVEVTFPSNCPYVVATGGTMGYPQQVWAEGEGDDALSSGGGFSTRVPRPCYQDDAIKAFLDTIGSFDEGKYNPDGRGTPDLSAMASGIPFYVDGELIVGGGTSSAAPIAASVLAFVNSARKAAGKPTIGWIHPVIYQHPQAFDDIVKGANHGYCEYPKGFNATKGWDAATGLGSMKFPELLAAFGLNA